MFLENSIHNILNSLAHYLLHCDCVGVLLIYNSQSCYLYVSIELTIWYIKALESRCYCGHIEPLLWVPFSVRYQLPFPFDLNKRNTTLKNPKTDSFYMLRSTPTPNKSNHSRIGVYMSESFMETPSERFLLC